LSEDLLNPGDFVLIKKRESICKYERTSLRRVRMLARYR
jgi:hypothetical protein